MSYTTIILILGVIATAIYLKRTKNAITVLIAAIQTMSVGITLMIDQTIGYYAFGTAILLALLYPYISKDKGQEGRKWMWFFLLPILVTFVFGTFHLPGYGIFRLLMLLPIGIFIYALTTIRKFKMEIGFMIMFVADAIIKVIGFFI
jgi:hypothetical protein